MIEKGSKIRYSDIIRRILAKYQEISPLITAILQEMAQIHLNPLKGSSSFAHRFDDRTAQRLRALFSLSPEFSATPLHSMDTIAGAQSVDRLWVKDERARWKLGSFKAMGGAYAVMSLAAEDLSHRLARPITCEDILLGRAPEAAHMTFTAATAGNHGCAVAFGAKLARANAVVFVPESTSAARIAAIEDQGAKIVRGARSYEDACALAVANSTQHGWTIVSDTAWSGYEDIPTRIMQGYSVVAAEVCQQIPQAPTHVLLQGGVGGMAAPLAAYFTDHIAPAPRIIVAEAANTPCLMQSARQNRLAITPRDGNTLLGRLDCTVPSSIAWPILRATASAFVAVDDETALRATDQMARENFLTTPTGAAGLAALLCLQDDPTARAHLHIDSQSRILIVATERFTAIAQPEKYDAGPS